jgi:hypothetical protein
MGIKWKEIPGYSRYMVSEYGHVWGRRSGKILKPGRGGLFYEYIQYYLERDDGVRKQEKAHRLVATCFIGDGSGLEVDHIDNNKINNHYSNLRWVTHRENILKSYRDGRKVRAGIPFVFTDEIRAKMAGAKKKAVRANGVYYNSIEEMIRALGIYRKAFNRAMLSGGEYKGYKFAYI